MRAVVLVILSCLLVAMCGERGLGVPSARAEPSSPQVPMPTTVSPPERPLDTAVPFTDEPEIVASHPLSIDSWSRTGNGLRVYFTTGSPSCFGVHAAVDETAESVTVQLRGGSLPVAAGRPCVMIAVTGALDVALATPVAGRTVLSKS